MYKILEDTIEYLLTSRTFRYSVELGVGTGKIGAVLKRHTNYLVGVDQDKLRLQMAAEQSFYDELIISDLGTFNIPSQCDSIFLFDVIEHLPLDEGAILLRKFLNMNFIMLSTPSEFFYFAHNNHESLWNLDSLSMFGFNKFWLVEEPTSFLYGKKILAIKNSSD